MMKAATPKATRRTWRIIQRAGGADLEDRHAGHTSGGLAALLGWLLWGDFAWQMRERAVFPVAQLLLKHLHRPDKFVGLLVGSIPSALGMILGRSSTPSPTAIAARIGRRIPFLLAPTPFAVLARSASLLSPSLGQGVHGWLGPHAPGRGPSASPLFAVFWTIFEVAAVTNTAIFYALVNDVVPHELIGRFFGLFRAVSLFAGIVFNQWLIGRAEQHFQAIFIGVALLYGVGADLDVFERAGGRVSAAGAIGEEKLARLIGPVKTYLKDTSPTRTTSGFTLRLRWPCWRRGRSIPLASFTPRASA